MLPTLHFCWKGTHALIAKCGLHSWVWIDMERFVGGILVFLGFRGLGMFRNSVYCFLPSSTWCLGLHPRRKTKLDLSSNMSNGVIREGNRQGLHINSWLPLKVKRLSLILFNLSFVCINRQMRSFNLMLVQGGRSWVGSWSVVQASM